jgi:hypothetical protein
MNFPENLRETSKEGRAFRCLWEEEYTLLLEEQAKA